jgi:hypothetical protein
VVSSRKLDISARLLATYFTSCLPTSVYSESLRCAQLKLLPFTVVPREQAWCIAESPARRVPSAGHGGLRSVALIYCIASSNVPSVIRSDHPVLNAGEREECAMATATLQILGSGTNL